MRTLLQSILTDLPTPARSSLASSSRSQETLLAKSVITNRAPVLTAWATVVAERLGFKRQEALSIAHVMTSINAHMAKGGKQPSLGENQPFVDLMGRKVSQD